MKNAPAGPFAHARSSERIVKSTVIQPNHDRQEAVPVVFDKLLERTIKTGLEHWRPPDYRSDNDKAQQRRTGRIRKRRFEKTSVTA